MRSAVAVAHSQLMREISQREMSSAGQAHRLYLEACAVSWLELSIIEARCLETRFARWSYKQKQSTKMTRMVAVSRDANWYCRIC